MCAAVEEVLQNEFGKKLGDDEVFIIDPATGTGNFVVNLLRRAHTSNPRHFERFYKEQLFANEVMLMPYYIASLNIEHEYYDLTDRYEPFEGICFVDTLDLAEGAQMRFSFMTEENTARVERQKQAPITVIIGNPPYNVGQINENDNNKNRTYEIIDTRVQETYVKESNATLKNKLYDPYVKFFRWATDRLGGRDGIVCLVTNNSFVDQIAFDGMRKQLFQDFSQIYHADLHGNVRQNPKLSGTTHNVFGIQVGVGITVAIRSSKHADHKLFYRRVQEDWRKEEKLAWLLEHVELDGKQNALNTVEWHELIPDDKNNWLISEHAKEFDAFVPIASKDSESIFGRYSLGVSTNRDTTVYDFDRSSLEKRIEQFCDNYNAEVDRYKRSSGNKGNIDTFVDYGAIKWSSTLKRRLQSGVYAEYKSDKIRNSLYRPFSKQCLYFDSLLIDRPGLFRRLFPRIETEQENAVIWLKTGTEWPVFALVTDVIPNLLPQGGSQCFPFYVYDEDGGNRRENITDWALGLFRARYGDPTPVSPPHRNGEGRQGWGCPNTTSKEKGLTDGSKPTHPRKSTKKPNSALARCAKSRPRLKINSGSGCGATQYRGSSSDANTRLTALLWISSVRKPG